MLYPLLEKSDDEAIAYLSRTYRTNMTGIAHAFILFSKHWTNARTVRDDPEGFRNAANDVLRRIHDRMVQENRHFYPAVEAFVPIRKAA